MATTAAPTLQVFVGADISAATKGLNTVSKSISSFTGDMARTAAGVGLATLGLDAFGNVADGLRKASGVGFARDMEEVNAQLTAMLGSGDAAAAMISGIRTMADQTPFGFIELSKAAASLVPILKRTGAPMDEMLNTVMALAAYDPAQGLEGAAFALREFASGDLLSLKRRFEIDTGINMGLVDARAKTTGGRLNTFADLLGSISLEAGKPILAAFA